jgi:hypothetical protein
MRALKVALVVGLGLSFGCNQEEPPEEMVVEEALAPDGTVIVSSLTEGGDTLGSYTVQTDGSVAAGIVSDRLPLVVSAVPAGPHSIELLNIPVGCTIDGEHPRNITVGAGDTLRVQFKLDCDP